jgi:hypothetical protein
VLSGNDGDQITTPMDVDSDWSATQGINDDDHTTTTGGRKRRHADDNLNSHKKTRTGGLRPVDESDKGQDASDSNTPGKKDTGDSKRCTQTTSPGDTDDYVHDRILEKMGDKKSDTKEPTDKKMDEQKPKKHDEQEKEDKVEDEEDDEKDEDEKEEEEEKEKDDDEEDEADDEEEKESEKEEEKEVEEEEDEEEEDEVEDEKDEEDEDEEEEEKEKDDDEEDEADDKEEVDDLDVTNTRLTDEEEDEEMDRDESDASETADKVKTLIDRGNKCVQHSSYQMLNGERHATIAFFTPGNFARMKASPKGPMHDDDPSHKYIDKRTNKKLDGLTFSGPPGTREVNITSFMVGTKTTTFRRQMGDLIIGTLCGLFDQHGTKGLFVPVTMTRQQESVYKQYQPSFERYGFEFGNGDNREYFAWRTQDTISCRSRATVTPPPGEIYTQERDRRFVRGHAACHRCDRQG